MSGVIFRPATPEDEPVLLRMMRSLAEQEPGSYFFDELVGRRARGKFLADPSLGRAWIFFSENNALGYIVLTYGYSFEFHGRDAFIDELYVEPQVRRQGIGRRAMQFVADHAGNLGVNAIHLEVDDGNIAAEELYRRVSYTRHGRVLMTKWLAARHH